MWLCLFSDAIYILIITSFAAAYILYYMLCGTQSTCTQNNERRPSPHRKKCSGEIILLHYILFGLAGLLACLACLLEPSSEWFVVLNGLGGAAGAAARQVQHARRSRECGALLFTIGAGTQPRDAMDKISLSERSFRQCK